MSCRLLRHAGKTPCSSMLAVWQHGSKARTCIVHKHDHALEWAARDIACAHEGCLSTGEPGSLQALEIIDPPGSLCQCGARLPGLHCMVKEQSAMKVLMQEGTCRDHAPWCVQRQMQVHALTQAHGQSPEVPRGTGNIQVHLRTSLAPSLKHLLKVSLAQAASHSSTIWSQLALNNPATTVSTSISASKQSLSRSMLWHACL